MDRDARSRRSPPPGEVRLIGGVFRRSKLPVADRPGLRPTPDRVRETLFNWLGQDLSGWRVLDAFAGSGALGFEAASRGAAEVLLVEHDALLARSLAESAKRLGAAAVRVQRGDAMAALAAPLVVDGGYLYLETGSPPAELPAGFEAWRQLKAGAVQALLLRRAR